MKTSPLAALRSVIYMALLVITVMPYAICMLLWFWLPMPQRYWMVRGWTGFAIWAARVVCGIRWVVKGRENFPDGPAVVLCKHQSAWETLFLTVMLPRPLCYVYKREIHLIPFFGWAIQTLNMIHINRSKGHDAFEQVVEQGSRRLAQGAWIIMFPEGTRMAPGAAPRYKTGGARLAVRTGVPIIPIALNSGEVWPRRAFVKLPGTITVSIGPLIKTEGLDVDQALKRAQDWIEGEMRRIAPHRYPDKAAANGVSAPGTPA